MSSALSAVFLVLALAVVAASSIQGLVRDEQRVAHTHAVVQSLDEVLLGADGAETSQRGFLITGDERFLQPYAADRMRAHSGLAAVQALVTDNPEQQRALFALRHDVDQKLRFIDSTLDIRRTRGLAAAAAAIATGRGIALGTHVHDDVEAMRAREQHLLARRSARENGSLRKTKIIGAAGILVAVLLAFTALELTRRTVDILAAHRRTSSYVRSLLDSTNDGIYGIDTSGEIIFVNRAAAETLGYEPNEMIGRPSHPLVHHTRPDGSPYPDSQCPISRTAAGGAGAKIGNEIIWRRDGTSLPVEYSTSPVVDPQGRNGAVVSFRDITERQSAEAALRQEKELAEQANVAKSDFLARMSHELRTPLNSVIGFANILLRNKSANLREQDLAYLGRIQRNGVHLLGLINGILDLSKIEAGHMEMELSAVSLDSVVQDVLAHFEPQLAGKPVHLTATVPGRLAALWTDRDKLQQVLTNVVGNAVRFTERGSIEIVVIALEDTGVPLRIEIRDSGIGVSPENIAAIFEPFEQVEQSMTRRFGGTGMGLPISRSLCQLLGFELTASSQVGAGSTFVIDLDPSARTTGQVASVSATDEERIAGSGATMRGRVALVVDDDSDARRLVARLVAEMGGRTLEAASGEEGLMLARAEAPDVIILDLVMPVVSGREVLRRLKSDAALHSIPVVVVSAEVADRANGLDGALSALPKPLDAGELAKALAQALGIGRVLIVDDDSDTQRLLTGFAYEEGASAVYVARDGAEALAVLDQFQPDLILLDIVMPHVDGMQVLSALAAHPRRTDFSVIVVSSRDVSSDEVRGLDVVIDGALRKGADLEPQLRSVLRSHVARSHPTPRSVRTVGA